MPPSTLSRSHRLLPNLSSDTSAAPAEMSSGPATDRVGLGEVQNGAARAGFDSEVGQAQAAQLELGFYRTERQGQ